VPSFRWGLGMRRFALIAAMLSLLGSAHATVFQLPGDVTVYGNFSQYESFVPFDFSVEVFGNGNWSVDVTVNGIEQSGCSIAGPHEGGGCTGTLLGGNQSALFLPSHNINVSESWFGDVSIAVFVDLPPGFTLTAPVPEPSTWAMMILGFAGIGAMAYRRRKGAMLAV
jgi:hypothetical protein